METPLWEQRNQLVPFPSTGPQHKQRATCGEQCSSDTGCLVCLHQQQQPLALQWSCLLSHSCLSSSTAGLTPRRPAQAPAHTMSPDQIWEGLSSIGGDDRSYFTSTQEHTLLKVATFRPGTKHCQQQVGRSSTNNWPEG